MARRGTEAFPDLGAHCDKEDCNQLDFLPFDCDGCGKVFCAEHRTYRDHGCVRAVDQGRTVVVCEACGDAIEHGPGEAEGDQDSSSSSSPLDPSLAPLLLFDYRDGAPGEASDDDTVFFYSIPKRQLLTRRADDFRGHRYWTTPQGWVLMLHLDSHTTFLWNPLTLQRISLPLDQENLLQGTKSRCLLSQKPTDPECVVLVLDLTDTVIYYCHPGGNQWFKHQYQLETHLSSDDDAVRLMEGLTMVGGKFYAYWIDQFVRLEFSPNPIFKIDTLNDYCSFPTGYNMADFCILECCGELFGLYFCHPLDSYQKIMQIAVHKMDFSRGAWVKVDTLSDMLFFINIGRSYGASFDAREVDLKGNCIYFVIYDDKALYVYDMERGTTTMHNPGPSLQDSIAPEFFMPPV